MTYPKSDLRVTPAQEWQRQTELLALPSGKVVEVRDVDVIGMLFSNPEGVPDFITQQLLDGLRNGGSPKSPSRPPAVDLSPSDLPALVYLADLITRACVVNPRIVDGKPNYAAGEIALADINLEDRLFIFGRKLPSEEMATAQRFRRGPATGLAVVSEGEDVRGETESAAGAE